MLLKVMSCRFKVGWLACRVSSGGVMPGRGIGVCGKWRWSENSEGADHVTLRYILRNEEAERFWTKLGFEQMITTARADLKELESRVSQCSGHVGHGRQPKTPNI